MTEVYSPIVKMLVLSTAHITEETNNRLLKETESLEKLPIVVYEKSSYGFLIAVPDDPANPGNTEPITLNGLPNDLWRVLNYARENGCLWVMLDSDGVIIKELPSYDW